MANPPKSWFSPKRVLENPGKTPVVNSEGTGFDFEQGGGAPYLVYTALLLQEGTDAPVATVLQNTIGNIVWSYGGVGFYYATLAGAFTANKTYVSVSYNLGQSGIGGLIVGYGLPNIDTVDVFNYLGDYTQVNDIAFSIEIRVYP